MTFTKAEFKGQPFVLQDWQGAIVVNALAWKNALGLRRYREVFIYIPRKNGKTEMCAGFCVVLFLLDEEPSVDVVCAAAEGKQAGLVWRAARTMMQAKPSLASRMKPYQHSIVKLVDGEPDGGSFKPISAEAYSKHGDNLHGIVIDELHTQPNRELTDTLVTSTGSRRQPLIFYITTADYVRDSVCNEKHEYAKRVRDGIVSDPEFLPVVYEASREDDWTSPEVWRKANPNYGVSVKEDYFIRQCRKAKDDPAFENTFKRLHLNIQTEAVNRCLNMISWVAAGNGVDPRTWRLEALARFAGKPCVAGMDFGSSDDLTALVLLFRTGVGKYAAIPWFWLPKMGRHTKDIVQREQYLTWVAQGFIEVTDGAQTEYPAVRRKILELWKVYRFGKLIIDKAMFGNETAVQFKEDGIDVVDFTQSWLNYAAPMKRMKELVVDQAIEHGNNPVLSWMAANLSSKVNDDGQERPVKPEKNSPLKIDGMVALLMALAQDMLQPVKTWAYANRGVIRV